MRRLWIHSQGLWLSIRYVLWTLNLTLVLAHLYNPEPYSKASLPPLAPFAEVTEAKQRYIRQLVGALLLLLLEATFVATGWTMFHRTSTTTSILMHLALTMFMAFTTTRGFAARNFGYTLLATATPVVVDAWTTLTKWLRQRA
eukprot:m.68060 g.68060  ORF g.68060 m.68060 type:complete len:143 (+) comp12186_c1_seq1:86-514(+)